MTTMTLLGKLRDMYRKHRAARVLSKALSTVALADPAAATLDALAKTQTVATAHATSAEVFARGDDVLVEVKARTTPVDLGIVDIGYFTRVRATVDYDMNKTGFFMLSTVTLDPDLAGINPYGEMRMVGDDLVPVAGANRVNDIGGTQLVTSLRASFGPVTLGEVQVIMPSYDIGPLTVDAETIHAKGDNVFKGVFRGHVGYDLMDNLRAGVGGEVDMDYHNRGFDPVDTRAGVFVRIMK